MTAIDEPIRPDELEELFGAVCPSPLEPCALAVSGGVDSTAMMALFADWLGQRGWDTSKHWVLTVDHGLRAGSATEADTVGQASRALGFRHATLVWEGAKPATAIQLNARRARYGLMTEHMRKHGMRLLLTAHTRDDQAETVLMRLARGSGVDGLSGMAPLSQLGSGEDAAALPAHCAPMPRIGRPLLGVPKARLAATLRARGMSWLEDPTNQMPMHERTRLRASRTERESLGLSDAMLALAARRLQRARRTLDLMVDRFCACGDGVAASPCGFFSIDRAKLRNTGDEVALRVLGRCASLAGGSGEPVPLAGLEAIADEILAGGRLADGRWTLARAMLSTTPDTVTVEREPPRQPLPSLTLAAGARALWDGRFVVAAGSAEAAGGEQSEIDVRPLGEARLAELCRQGAVALACPARIAALVPAFFQGGTIQAVPSLGYWATPEQRARLAASFAGIGNSRVPELLLETERCVKLPPPKITREM